MAIDGWVCRTRQPMVKEVGLDVKAFRNRNSCWAIVVLAGCDAKLRFDMVSVRSSGSTHDHLIWESSAVKNPTEYVIGVLIGDRRKALRRSYDQADLAVLPSPIVIVEPDGLLQYGRLRFF